MKKLFEQRAQNTKLNFLKATVLCISMVLVTSCGEVDKGDGTVTNTQPLPTDTQLNLYCVDAGIANETCILDDPANPYAGSPFDIEALFEELDPAAPGPKARFYLWGTAQARQPQGVYQYFTALHLHYLFGESGSELVREQAKRAYRSLLDNYFDSVWFLKEVTPGGDILYPRKLNKLVGINLVDPNNVDALHFGLVPLYADSLLAEQDIGEWGFTFDSDTRTMSVNR